MISLKQKQRAVIVRRMLKKLVPDAGMILRYKNSWELLVAVVLSAQCTDKKVNEVTARLFQKYKTLNDYVRANKTEFERDIFSTGFYRAKTKNILAAAKMVKHEYGGKVPDTMEELLRIPGVARKTANIILGNAFNKVEGIAVDTHVGRLAKKFKLTHHDNPDKIERDLSALVPKKEWFVFTYWMIEYGRRYSPARIKDHTDPVSVALKKKQLL